MEDFTLPPKLFPFLQKAKPFKVAIGGRSGGKSTGLGVDIALLKVMQDGWKFACMREFQKSIKHSVLSLIESEIIRLKLPMKKTKKIRGKIVTTQHGFEVQKDIIYYRDNVAFTFQGLARNLESIKGLNDYNCFIIEEAATISQESIDILEPTLRKAGAEMWLIGNPGSSADPFSKTYINPYLTKLDANGYYEDDEIMFQRINYMDNPFNSERTEIQRLRDKKRLSTAMYNWVWLGEFNDSVDDSIISVDMFNACIDAHKTLGWEPTGATIVAHDPSDLGHDSKGIAVRVGNVITMAAEKDDGDVKAGCTWSTDIAKQVNADYYLYDSDGLGAGLAFQVETELKGVKIETIQFKGSRMAEDPDQIYQDSTSQDAKTNRETFKNRRAQYYFRLREMMYNTYLAVIENKYIDPATMISFDSDGIEDMDKLRSELCRIPQKLNNDGWLQIMPKNEMKSKYGIDSPNVGDSVMMTMFDAPDNNDDWNKPLNYTDVGVV